MKRAVILVGLFLAAVFAYAQDRFPIQDENPEVIQLLLDAGYDDLYEYSSYITYTNPWEKLLWINAPLPFYEKLLALGKNVEPEFGNGIYESPLVMAIQRNNYDVVNFLISKGANVNREHRFKRIPLHFAAEKNPDILDVLIRAGADVNRKDESGWTPLHRAASVETIQILLSHNADINAKTNDGLTPLMVSVFSFVSRLEIVQAILQGNPDINAVNNNGQSALILAAGNVNDPRIITLLLNARANARLEDNTGRTALDWFDMNRRINWSPVRKELKDRT